MNPFAVLSILAVVISVSIATITIVRNPRAGVNRVFAFFCVLIAYASITEYGYRQADSYEQASLWLRVEAFWPLALSALMHFTLAFTGRAHLLKNWFTWVVLYTPALFFSLFDLIYHIFELTTVREVWGWGYVTNPGLVTYIGAVWVLFITCSAPYLCWRYYRQTKDNEQKQAKFVAIGLTAAAAITLPTSFVFTLLAIPSPSLITTAFIVGGIFILYAILKYELLSPQTAAEEILNTMLDMVFLVGADGKIARVNGTVLKMLGYGEDELTGRDLNTFLMLKTQNRIDNTYRLAVNEVKDIEMMAKPKGGQGIAVSVSSSVVRDRTGAVKGYVYVVRDISERKEFENRLQMLYEQEKVLRQDREQEIKRRADFTRALVHELMTPLTGVVASSELLADGVKGEVLPKVVNNILQSASLLSNRINELLDLARGETGMLQLKKSVFRPAELIQNATEVMSVVLAAKRQQLRVEASVDPPDIHADKDRLLQVILNLVDNASKYSNQGENISLRVTADSNFLIVSVQDTGHGIPKEEQPYLFNPYTRLEGEQRKVGGMGLGLAICKILVELHGGKIWVESQEARGSTFTFTVPLWKGNGGNA